MLAHPLVIVLGMISGIGVYAAAVALGFRHGIDWDHIAAITDITSATASGVDEDESWLMGEPGLMLTDERHHLQHARHEHGSHTHDYDGHASEAGDHDDEPPPPPAGGRSRAALGAVAVAERPVAASAAQGRQALAAGHAPTRAVLFATEHIAALRLGTLYALGHGSVVFALGMLAILTAKVLPGWIDPVMERVVGVTLVFLAVYLFYSVYRYFRGGGEFRIRSRWMLVFAGVANSWHWIRSHFGHHEHRHVAPSSYTGRTAFAIGMIHGVGAETGTQALVIAAAVGATSTSIAIVTLGFFLVGLLLSNSVVTVMSTVGFVSARRRQLIYVLAGLVAAVFSLVVGLFFLLKSADLLPALDQYVRWIGGPK